MQKRLNPTAVQEARWTKEAADEARSYARERRENPNLIHTCWCGRELPEGYWGSRLCGDMTCDERQEKLPK